MSDKNFDFLKIIFFLFYILFFITTTSFVLPGPAAGATDVRGSMVKIYCVQNAPDYDNPWNMSGPEMVSGSGCVIEGNRILTNAHVVSDHTYILVRLHGQFQKYQARILAISHEADLALLSVDNSEFFEGVKPLTFGKLPEVEQEVVVCGFPEGGDSLSTTKGVISRIENQRYAHSWLELLAGQLDAAINPGNSGGPVMVGNRIVGVVMQTRKKSENIGYMVPVTVIKHFLIDLEDGRYDGFPEDGIIFQPLENQSLKDMYGLDVYRSGVLVTSVIPGSPAKNKIFPDDILLSVDGHQIADDGTVEFRPKERTGSDIYVKQHQIGENVVYKILRNGKEKTVSLRLDKNYEKSRLVPMEKYDVRPSYYIYGGLVFCPFSLNYLLSWGDDWSEDAPYSLLTYFVDGKLSRAGEEVVIIIKVLADEINNGYDKLVNSRIVEVNGKKILNLRDLIRTVEADTAGSYVVFKTEDNESIAIDRKRAEEAQEKILTTYEVSDDRSPDLKAKVDTNKNESNEVAKASSVQAN
jgi:S1-C subfamily serine protease